MSADRSEPAAPAAAPARAGKPADTERCFSGRLKQIAVDELLTFLSVNRKTGKLTLTRREGSGLLVFRNGRIIYAASSSVRETFGNILICRRMISEATLADALERLHGSGENKRLGTVLIEMGQVRHEDVEQVVRYQVGCVLSELTQWTEGYFHFDRLEIPEGGEIEVDAKDFVVAEGLSTEHIMLAIAADMDERGRAGAADSRQGGQEASGAPETQPEGLSAILKQLPTPALRGEKTEMLLRFAARTLSRGVLFMIRGERAEGIGHFGLPEGRASHAHPEVLRVPLDEASILSEAVQRKAACRGPLRPGVGNDRLHELLGGDRPDEVLAIPVLVEGRVALVLYGDNGPRNEPIGGAHPLELELTQAGLDIEKDTLEGRLKSFAQARRRLET